MESCFVVACVVIFPEHSISLSLTQAQATRLGGWISNLIPLALVWTGGVACRYASLFNEHAIAIGIETVFLFYGVAVGAQHTGSSAERAYQHKESGLGQMKVG